MADDLPDRGVTRAIALWDGTDLKYLDWDTIEAIKDALELIEDLRAALSSIGTDELDVNVEASVLPTGAATQATLADALTALQIIDGYADEDNVLFGYNDRYYEREYTDTADAGTNTLTFSTVPAGEVWVVYGGISWDNDSAVDYIAWELYNDGSYQGELVLDVTVAKQNMVKLEQHVVLKAGDNIRVSFGGCTAGDDLRATAWGYKMKV